MRRDSSSEISGLAIVRVRGGGHTHPHMRALLAVCVRADEYVCQFIADICNV